MDCHFDDIALPYEIHRDLEEMSSIMEKPVPEVVSYLVCSAVDFYRNNKDKFTGG